jgi:hypothetical protein
MKIFKVSQSNEYDMKYFEKINQELPIQELDQMILSLKQDIINLKSSIEIPQNTCPIIDSVIKELKDSESMAKEIQKSENLEDIYSLASDIEWSVSNSQSSMEEIRSANDELRTIGKEWYIKCKDIIENFEDLKGYF